MKRENKIKSTINDLDNSGSGTIFFVDMFSLCIAGTGAVDISSVSGVAGSVL